MYEYAYHSPAQASYFTTPVPHTAPLFSPQYATTGPNRPPPRGHYRQPSYTYAAPRSAPLRPPPTFGYFGIPTSPFHSPAYNSSDEHVSHSTRRPPPVPRFRTSIKTDRTREKTVPSHSHQYGDSYTYSRQFHSSPEDLSSRFYSQVRDRHVAEETPTRAHTRSNSHSTRQPQPRSPKPSKSKSKTWRAATDADCRAHDIPKGFSTKNWNPDEEPILLLGSVFDANTIGRWIYDWTAVAHNPHEAIPQMAAELWLLLIQTAGKMKMAREVMPKIRKEIDREMVGDFIDGGERMMEERLVEIIKKSEAYMLKRALKLGKNTGVDFVECMFGRDRELLATEQLIHSLGLWNKRYDANCGDIVKHPSR